MPSAETVYLSLGSNLGDRAASIDRAIAALAPAGLRVLARSPLYETEPVDFLAQPSFLNCAVQAETELTPEEVLHALQKIERDLHGKKLFPRGPRTIDLDLLFYGTRVICTPELDVPHPRMTARRFVLVPLAGLAPGLRHPVNGLTIAELLAVTPDHSAVALWNPGRD